MGSVVTTVPLPTKSGRNDRQPRLRETGNVQMFGEVKHKDKGAQNAPARGLLLLDGVRVATGVSHEL